MCQETVCVADGWTVVKEKEQRKDGLATNSDSVGDILAVQLCGKKWKEKSTKRYEYTFLE